ncbi:MAG: hypothetical protein JXA58_05990 [Dehalococcoidia bacterium]|nr:hypothetical protein [Dehalococcoidia bacterium]
MRATTIALAIVLALILVSCQAVDVPGAEVKPEILIEPAPGSYLSTSHGDVTQILLEEATVTLGVCDEDVGDLKMGDPCILVSGRITSHDTESWLIALRAHGQDENGLTVVGTQESFMIPGRAGVEARYGETAAFVIHLNTSDEVETIRLYAQSHSYEESQPRPPSTPLPQEELTRITFSRMWLLENDVEPDEGTVTITFPASWLQEPPEIPEGEETVELSVPERLLMDHNTSDNPTEITVTFPDYYFDGL